jgi:hypothetical protein
MNSLVKKSIKFMLAVIMLSALSCNLYAQENIIKQSRDLPSFNSIEVGGAFTVILSQGGEQSVVVETDEENIDKVITEVNGNVLEIHSRNIRNSSKLTIYVNCININRIEASGASKVIGEKTIDATQLSIEASGAADIKLVLNASDLQTDISGAATVKLEGKATNHSSEVSGAANLRTADLETSKTNIEVSGAANAKVNAKDELIAEVTGAGNLSSVGEPTVKKIDKNGTIEIQMQKMKEDLKGLENLKDLENLKHLEELKDLEHAKVIREYSDDSTKVTVKIIDEDADEGDSDNDDSSEIYINHNNRVRIHDGNVEFHHNHGKFNGHWAGLGLGINGYLTSDGKLDMPAEYKYLDLHYEKSVNVDINFFEQNINLIKRHFGLVTGLGLTFNNYRFDNNVILVPDSSKIFGYYDNSKESYKKSKLLVTYLTLPLLFEYQTNNNSDINSFHFTAGVIGGIRIGSHTKNMYDGDKKTKNRDDFYLNPFKLDATARIGWGVLNLYGNYSLTTLFKNDKGPELYPYSIGISFDIDNW